MRLIVITGTCGAGKSTIRDRLETMLDPARFACIETDGLGINWWDYAGTDHEYRFSDDCLKAAVERAGGRDIVFAGCISPEDYIGKHTIPPEIDTTVFIVLCPSDEVIRARLAARPKSRGFDTEEAVRPQIEYNRWFRKNRGKFPLFIDNSAVSVEETADRIAAFILRLPE